MARIAWSDLVVVLENAPGYGTKIRKGVGAEQALYIAFGDAEDGRPGQLDSEVFEMIDGAQLVIDRDREGRVWGIEIC
ncbi:MAG: hypothetical protein AAGD38_19840 [Acidobacteriota bacterium]